MSILSNIFHAVFDKVYPLVKSIINDVEGIAHEEVQVVRERFFEAARRIERQHSEIAIEVEIDLEPDDGRVPAAILDVYARQRELKEKTSYDWRHSPEDLLKLLDMPAGFGSRRALAETFGMPEYKGTERDGEELLNRLKAKFVIA